MRWVLDDGPFGMLAQHFNPGWVWSPELLEVVESVAAGAAADKSGRRQSLLNLLAAGEPAIAVRSLAFGSPGALAFEYLRKDEVEATKNVGEDESIAYCMTEASDAIFVTFDKVAAHIALAELGGARVASTFDLWFWLADKRMISERERDALCQAFLKKDSTLPGIPLRLRPPA